MKVIKNKTVPVQVRLTEKMIRKAEKLVIAGLYVNISDVIRDGLRKTLKEVK